MSKLSKLFMALSVLSFAVPAFAGRRVERSQLGCDRRRILDGVCFRNLRSGSGQSHRCGG